MIKTASTENITSSKMLSSKKSPAKNKNADLFKTAMVQAKTDKSKDNKDVKKGALNLDADTNKKTLLKKHKVKNIKNIDNEFLATLCSNLQHKKLKNGKTSAKGENKNSKDEAISKTVNKKTDTKNSVKQATAVKIKQNNEKELPKGGAKPNKELSKDSKNIEKSGKTVSHTKVANNKKEDLKTVEKSNYQKISDKTDDSGKKSKVEQISTAKHFNNDKKELSKDDTKPNKKLSKDSKNIEKSGKTIFHPKMANDRTKKPLESNKQVKAKETGIEEKISATKTEDSNFDNTALSKKISDAEDKKAAVVNDKNDKKSEKISKNNNVKIEDISNKNNKHKVSNLNSSDAKSINQPTASTEEMQENSILKTDNNGNVKIITTKTVQDKKSKKKIKTITVSSDKISKSTQKQVNSNDIYNNTILKVKVAGKIFNEAVITKQLHNIKLVENKEKDDKLFDKIETGNDVKNLTNQIAPSFQSQGNNAKIENNMPYPMDKIIENIEKIRDIKPPFNKSITIEVSPPHIGSIEINVKMDKYKNINISINAHDNDIVKLIGVHSDKLKEYLNLQGIKIDQIDVSNKPQTGGNNFNFFQQNQGNNSSYQGQANYRRNDFQSFSAGNESKEDIIPVKQEVKRKMGILDVTA